MSLTHEEKIDRAGCEKSAGAGSWTSLFRNIIPTATSVLPAAASLVYPTATKMVTSALTSSKKKPEPGPSRKTEEEKMDLAGTDKLKPAGLPLATVARMQLRSGMFPMTVADMLFKNGWSSNKINAFLASQGLDVRVRGWSEIGKAAQGVVGIQRALASIGMPVRATGKIDSATVEGVNNILRGWDDAPPSLKKGELTSAGIARNLPAVSKAIRLALKGAKDFGDATHPDE